MRPPVESDPSQRAGARVGRQRGARARAVAARVARARVALAAPDPLVRRHFRVAQRKGIAFHGAASAHCPFVALGTLLAVVLKKSNVT